LAASKNAKNTRLASRPSFAKVQEQIDLPDLLSLQTESFEWLIGGPSWRAKEGNKAKTGLDEVFEEISPIEDSANSSQDPKMGLVFGDPVLYDLLTLQTSARPRARATPNLFISKLNSPTT